MQNYNKGWVGSSGSRIENGGVTDAQLVFSVDAAMQTEMDLSVYKNLQTKQAWPALQKKLPISLRLV